MAGPTSSRASGTACRAAAHGGTGIAVYRGAVYAESNDRILRYALSEGNPVPSGKPEIVVQGLPLTGDHPMHPFAIDSSGGLYIDLGSATNACQIENRIPLSTGHQPCTELQTRGGIWRYDANQKGQRFSPAARFATGIRNADGIAVDSTGRGSTAPSTVATTGGELAQALPAGAGCRTFQPRSWSGSKRALTMAGPSATSTRPR